MKLLAIFILYVFFSQFSISQQMEIDYVKIPGGTFMMGSTESEAGRQQDEMQHQVTLSSFWMSKNEITFAQYDYFCEKTGRSKPDDEVGHRGMNWGRGNRPAINVSWDDAVAFATWMGGRLPTEAEWEYACRSGTTTPYNTGDTITWEQCNLSQEYGSKLSHLNLNKTSPVGSYPPNQWGLKDMHGNVAEWCSDWYAAYSPNPQLNPKGPELGKFRITRGGVWESDHILNRSALRASTYQDEKSEFLGFRIVMDAENWDKNRRILEHYLDSAKKRIVIQWVDIHEGNFMMGTKQKKGLKGNGHYSYSDETERKVEMSAFKMSKNEITFEQYDIFCELTGREKPDDLGMGRGNRPVINVSWNDAHSFAKWLGCNLPSQEEWEYTCRAGTNTPFSTGKKIMQSQENFDRDAPYEKHPTNKSAKNQTSPVGSYPPNPWGLNDMHGNVREWTRDTYDTYDKTLGDNYWGIYANIRGGSWTSSAEECRCPSRDSDNIEETNGALGFRIVAY